LCKRLYHPQDIDAADVSPELISRVTGEVKEPAAAWRSRTLEPLYPALFPDAVDGLTGFPEAVTAVFPRAEVQLCMRTNVRVRMVRKPVRFIPYQDRKAVTAALQKIELPPAAEAASLAPEDFAGTSYPYPKTPQNPQPPLPRLKTETLRLKTWTLRLKTETLRLKTGTPRLKTETLRLKTETLRLKTETLRLKTETLRLSILSQNPQIIRRFGFKTPHFLYTRRPKP
jgi:hypothetical protein